MSRFIIVGGDGGPREVDVGVQPSPDPKPCGRPPRDPKAGRARSGVNIRLTDAEATRFGRAALAAGYVRNDGTAAIGAWLRALGDAATK